MKTSMTPEEFSALPYLLTVGQVTACGYSAATLEKFVECDVLRIVKPVGCTQRRFQKVQVAALLGWDDCLALAAWGREKPLLRLTALCQWTGYDKEVIGHIVAAGGLTVIQPGGLGYRMFRKREVGEWLGMLEVGRQSAKSGVKPSAGGGQMLVRRD